MIAELLSFLTAGRRNSLFPSGEAPSKDGPVRAAAAAGHIGVIDATEHGLGDSLTRMLDIAQVPAICASPLELLVGFDLVALLVPIDPRKLSEVGMVLLSTIDDVHADADLRSTFTSAIVIVWVVEADDRARYATSSAGSNRASTLIGTAWQRQLMGVGGDRPRAATHRSRSIARITHADSTTDTTTHADAIAALDDNLVHALVCRHPQSHRLGGVIEWESTIAAIALRGELRASTIDRPS